MSNYIISIIIPIYNREQYLTRAVNSVLEQQHSERLQLILVDDGSTDKSLELALSIAKSNSNIIVLHQENAGVSSARNKGIEAASGKYCTFLDSDDWWEKDFLDKDLIAKLEAEDSPDVIGFSFREVTYNYRLQRPVRVKTEILTYEADGFGRYDFAMVHSSFLFKRSLLEANGVRYPNCRTGEDGLFVELALYFARSYEKIDKCIYSYWENMNSLSHKESLVQDLKNRSVGLKKKEIFLKRKDINSYSADEEIIWQFANQMKKICAETSYKNSRSILQEYIFERTDSNPKLKGTAEKWHVWKNVTAYQKNPLLFWLSSKIFVGIPLVIKSLLFSLPGFKAVTNYVYSSYHRGFIPVDGETFRRLREK